MRPFVNQEPESHERHHLCGLDPVVFYFIGSVCGVLRPDEVRYMLDTVISLLICVFLLAYLVFAMLRPEKF